MISTYVSRRPECAFVVIRHLRRLNLRNRDEAIRTKLIIQDAVCYSEGSFEWEELDRVSAAVAHLDEILVRTDYISEYVDVHIRISRERAMTSLE